MAVYLHNKRLPHAETVTISATTLTVIAVPVGCVLLMLGDANALKLTTVNDNGEPLTLADDDATFPTGSSSIEYSGAEVAAGPPALQCGGRIGSLNGVDYTALGLAKVSGNVTLRLRVERPEGSTS